LSAPNQISSPPTYGIFRPVILMPKNTDWEDESVIRLFGAKSKSTYSLMLINMEAKKSGALPFYSNFNINAAEERITAIIRIKRTPPAFYPCLSYLHDILANNTVKTIVETEYCMSANDENGSFDTLIKKANLHKADWPILVAFCFSFGMLPDPGFFRRLLCHKIFFILLINMCFTFFRQHGAKHSCVSDHSCSSLPV
jgi:hypothetical protein